MRRPLDLAAELRRAAEIHHEMGDAVILASIWLPVSP
jgi:hypothetical protein